MLVPHREIATKFNDLEGGDENAMSSRPMSLMKSHSMYNSFFVNKWKPHKTETPKEVEEALLRWRRAKSSREKVERQLVRSLREKLPKEVLLKTMVTSTSSSPSEQVAGSANTSPSGGNPAIVHHGGEALSSSNRAEGDGAVVLSQCRRVSLLKVMPGRPATPTISPVSQTAVKDITMRRQITGAIVKEHEARVEESQRTFRERHERELGKLSREIEKVRRLREANRRSMHKSNDDERHDEGVVEEVTGDENGRSASPTVVAGQPREPFTVRCIDYCRGDGIVRPPPSGLAVTPRHVHLQVDKEYALLVAPAALSTKASKKQRVVRIRALPELTAARRRVLNDDPNASYWDSVVAEDRYRRAASASLVS